MHRVGLICLTIGRKVHWVASWPVNITLTYLFCKVTIVYVQRYVWEWHCLSDYGSGTLRNQRWHSENLQSPSYALREMRHHCFSQMDHGHFIEFIHAYQHSTALSQGQESQLLLWLSVKGQGKRNIIC